MVHWQKESIRKLLHIHYIILTTLDNIQVFYRKRFLLTGASAQYYPALTSFVGVLFLSCFLFRLFGFFNFLHLFLFVFCLRSSMSSFDSRRLRSITKFCTPPTWCNLSLSGRRYEKSFFNILKDIAEKIPLLMLRIGFRLLISQDSITFMDLLKKLTFLQKFHGLEKCCNLNTNKHIITNLTAK